jgi:hypothetical protein
VEGWALEGALVERREPGVVFATVGSATGEVEFPATGSYIIGVVARGTPCSGVYPIASITVNGQRFGSVAVADDQWRTYTAFGPMTQGRHKVSVAFVNDASDPPREDRNLWVDKVLLARDEAPGDVTFLTSPPTVAVVRRGKGRVVLDQLRWDTEERNSLKAARYAATLLTELGGEFPVRSGVAVECETMTPMPGMPHFGGASSVVHLASNGYVGKPVRIASAGRYRLELVASGTEAEGVHPHVKITLDDRTLGEVQLTTDGWRAYPLTVELPAGSHELRVHFTNDLWLPGVADRNLALDKVVFYRE